MRYSLLVAMREYAENVKTKGFWIGVLLFPVLLVASIKIPKLLEDKATPTRHFSLVDHSGDFGPIIDKAVERDHAKRTMLAIGEYTTAHSKQKGEPDNKLEQLENTPASGLPEMIQGFLDASPEILDKFIDEGGLQTALDKIKPLLSADAPPFTEPRPLFVRVDLPEGIDANADGEEIAKKVKPLLLGDEMLPGVDKKLFAFVYVPEDPMRQLKRPGVAGLIQQATGTQSRGIQYWSTNLTDTDLRSIIQNSVNSEVRRRLYAKEGIDSGKVAGVQGTRAILTSLNPKKEEGKEEVSLADTIRQWMPVAFVYLLFVALMTVVQMLLNNTVEEKANRIMEVLLSSVTPGELMRGKLMGIAGVGLTMLFTWILSIMGVLHFMAGPEVEWAAIALELLQKSGLLLYFAVYFILGYLLYAGLFLALGSVCSTLKEAQNLMGPVVMIMIVPLFTMVFVPKDPNGTLATVLSWIPLYTPFLMMNRAAADPPMFDLIGTGLLLVVSIAVVLMLTGKIFRIAILRTGQPPKILEMVRWLRD